MLSSPAPSPYAPSPYDSARAHMVEGQLRPNQVTDPRILAVMGQVPRELFVPSTLVNVAYLDEDMPLIAGRALMPPMVLARVIQALEIKSGDRVLDLAPGTGYSTLVLSYLAHDVIGVEPHALLCQEAETALATSPPHGKAKILAGAPVEGCGAYAPFDAILINGSVEQIPPLLFAQLSEGGRLAAVMRNPNGCGEARLYRKKNDGVIETILFDAQIRPAPGFDIPRGFAF